MVQKAVIRRQQHISERRAKATSAVEAPSSRNRQPGGCAGRQARHGYPEIWINGRNRPAGVDGMVTREVKAAVSRPWVFRV